MKENAVNNANTICTKQTTRQRTTDLGYLPISAEKARNCLNGSEPRKLSHSRLPLIWLVSVMLLSKWTHGLDAPRITEVQCRKTL
jgi:hypothetical protein